MYRSPIEHFSIAQLSNDGWSVVDSGRELRMQRGRDLGLSSSSRFRLFETLHHTCCVMPFVLCFRLAISHLIHHKCARSQLGHMRICVESVEPPHRHDLV